MEKLAVDKIAQRLEVKVEEIENIFIVSIPFTVFDFHFKVVDL